MGRSKHHPDIRLLQVLAQEVRLGRRCHEEEEEGADAAPWRRVRTDVARVFLWGAPAGEATGYGGREGEAGDR